MTRRGVRRLGAASMAGLALALAGPVAGASASEGSIKLVLEHDVPKVRAAEHHFAATLAEYKANQQAAPVQAAITVIVHRLEAMRSGVAAQHATKPRVLSAKHKIVAGVAAITVAYQHLDTAFGEASDQEAAESQARSAQAAVAAGKTKLAEGIRLLGG